MRIMGERLKWLRAAANEILEGARKAIDSLDLDQVEKMINKILEARDRKIFIIGMGRSGFVARAFTLRLMNLGFNVYFIGETVTPAVDKGDLLIAISGSGITKMVLTASETAKQIGAYIIAVTSRPDSPLGQLADHVVVVKGRTKIAVQENYLARQLSGEREPLTPLGTMFENNCMIFLDSLIVELMYRLQATEMELWKRHATIE